MGCIVTGTLRDTVGQPYTGIVRFEPWSHPTVSSGLILGAIAEVQCAADGTFSVTLELGNYVVRTRANKPFVISIPPGVGTADVTTLISSRFTWLTIPEGDESTVATPVARGLVKTDGESLDPVVYLKSQVDSLLDGVSSELTAVGLVAAAAEDTAATALAVADAAAASAAGFPVSSFLGTLTALNQDTGTAAANSGKWWQSGVAGTLTHANSGGHVVDVGDRLLSNGSTWQKWINPPTYIPDGVLAKEKFAPAIAQTITAAEVAPPLRRAFTDSSRFFSFDSGNGRRLINIDNAGKVTFLPGSAFIPSDAITTEFNQRLPRKTFNPTGYDNLIVVGDRAIGTVLPDGKVDITLSALASARLADEIAPTIGDELGLQIKRTFMAGRILEMVAPDPSGNLRVVLGILSDGSTTLTETQAPAVISGQEHLDQWFEFVVRRRLGETPTYVLNCIGDSWTWAGASWVHWMAKRLRSQYGSAGPGYISFCPTSADTAIPPTSIGDFAVAEDGSAVRTGTGWTKSSYDGKGPDLLQTTSTTVGEKVTLTLAVTCDTIRIHYLRKVGGGELRWRIGAGSWTTIDTSAGADTYTTSSIAVTGQAAPFTLDFEVLTAGANGVTLFGAEALATTPGIRVNRLGHSGARASHFAGAVDVWDAALAALAGQGTIISFGTNDQAAAITEAAFASACTTIATRLRDIQAGHDLVFLSPWENGAERATPIGIYDTGAYTAARANAAAMVSLPRLVGASPASYGSDTPTPWMSYPGTADLLHPSTRGNQLIAAWLLRALDSLN